MRVEISPQAETLIRDRRISAADILSVIEFCEKTKDFFINKKTGHCLATLSTGNTTYWVEYSPEPHFPMVYSAYTHRMKILEGVQASSKMRKLETDWSCAKCNRLLEWMTVRLSYLDQTFAVDIPACPSCGHVFVSEEDAVGKMAIVEITLEDK